MGNTRNGDQTGKTLLLTKMCFHLKTYRKPFKEKQSVYIYISEGFYFIKLVFSKVDN